MNPTLRRCLALLSIVVIHAVALGIAAGLFVVFFLLPWPLLVTLCSGLWFVVYVWSAAYDLYLGPYAMIPSIWRWRRGD